MSKPAVFIDRDGTINEQMGYINHVSRFRLLPGTAEAIRLLNRREYYAIVVSNQSGVARGYFPIQLVDDVQREEGGLTVFFTARTIHRARFRNLPSHAAVESPGPVWSGKLVIVLTSIWIVPI